MSNSTVRYGWQGIIRTEEEGHDSECDTWTTDVYATMGEARAAALDEIRGYFEENTIFDEDEEGYGKLIHDGEDLYRIVVGSYDIVFDGLVKVAVHGTFVEEPELVRR